VSKRATPAELFDRAVDAYERGDLTLALQGAEDVLRLEPGHPGALYMTGSLFLQAGRTAEALPRLQAAARSKPHDPGLLQVLGAAHLQLGRWQEAIAAYRSLLSQGHPSAELLNNLGMALKESGDLEAAIAVYREATETWPEDTDILNNLAIALNARRDYPAAIEVYLRAVALAPGKVDLWSNLATLYEQANMLDEAQAALERGLALAPQQENLQLVAARCERRRDALPEAAQRLERELARTDLDTGVRRVMEYELGRVYDMLGDTERAFAHLSSGNALTAAVWPQLPAAADEFLEDLEHRLAFFDQAEAAAWPASPAESRPSPVFLVGFQRSGTTLMDTMLEAHPAIAVMEEEPLLEKLLQEVRQLPDGYPQALATLTPEQIRSLRELYWRGADAVLGPLDPATLVLDKNPGYSAHAGFLKLLFPGARFIFALRHPCDVAFSCFMQAFGPNGPLHNFRDLPTTARTYQLTMDLWLRYRDTFALDVHELRYESLVADKQRELRLLLEFLGLEWASDLDDHTRQAKKRGRIYTPSYHQVIRPVYGDAVGRWERYRDHFGPALDILRSYIERFGYLA